MRNHFIAALACLLLTAGAAAAADPFGRPGVVRWGASVAATQTALRGRCASMVTRRVEPPFLDVIKDRQMQIDCEGFVFRGKPRHAEFVFGDDRLGMVWIMTEAAEAPDILADMTKAFGPPDHRNRRYEAFTAAGAALRLDRAEVLFYGPERARDCEPDFKPDIGAG